MATNLFSDQRTLANYEQAELLQQFDVLAKETGGKLNHQALRLSERLQVLISNLHWRNFSGDICLQRSWTIVVTASLYFPKVINGQIRLSNVYGATSGIPLIGAPRLETNWPAASVTGLLPPCKYWQLASAQEPFTLLVNSNQISLNTYRFYQSDFYLAAFTYLADLVEQIMLQYHPLQQHTSRTKPIELPWMQKPQG